MSWSLEAGFVIDHAAMLKASKDDRLVFQQRLAVRLYARLRVLTPGYIPLLE